MYSSVRSLIFCFASRHLMITAKDTGAALPNYPGWIAYRHRKRWNVFRYDAPGTDDSPASNCYPGQDDRVCTNPNVITDINRFSLSTPLIVNWNIWILELVIRGEDSYVLPHQNLAAYLHIAIQICVQSQFRIVPNLNITARSEEDVLAHHYVLPAIQENSLA